LRDVRGAAGFIARHSAQALKPPSKKCPEPCGPITHFAKADLVDGRGEGAVEDELFDKLGRLQQRVTLAGGLGQVLVQVAQKAGVPRGVSEVVGQRTSVRIDLLPELA
jgi:hypothetical protein